MERSPSFLRFSGHLAWRAFVLALKTLKVGDDVRGVLTSVLLLAGTSISLVAWWQQYARWWVPVGIFLALFFYGLCRASYEEVQKAGRAVKRVEQEREDLKEKLRAYEDSSKPKVLARLENPGPVTVEEWAPDEIEHMPDIDVVCVVPYKPYDTVSAFFDEPATTIDVEGPEDVCLITVNYEVRGETKPHPQGARRTQIDAGAFVLDEGGKVVRDLHLYMGMASISEDGSWQHAVHGKEIVSGLPKGVYGLNVFDYFDVPPDYRSNAPREYRNMRLQVTRQ